MKPISYEKSAYWIDDWPPLWRLITWPQICTVQSESSQSFKSGAQSVHFSKACYKPSAFNNEQILFSEWWKIYENTCK